MLETNGAQVYRITNPLPDESADALYVILDHSNPDNLLVKCINSGMHFPPVESEFKLSQLSRVRPEEVKNYPESIH